MFKKLITCHWFITSLIMAISALVFGLSTFKLFHLFRANLTFIYKYGWWALEEGGLQQFIELCGNGVISLSAYLVFKACERVLVDAMLK